jgi:hypothetical protein
MTQFRVRFVHDLVSAAHKAVNGKETIIAVVSSGDKTPKTLACQV